MTYIARGFALGIEAASVVAGFALGALALAVVLALISTLFAMVLGKDGEEE